MATRKERIEAMLVETPRDPELHYMLAMEHVSEGDDVGAVRCFEQLIEIDATYPPAYHQGARALARLDRIADAKAMIARGIPAALSKGDQHTAGEMQGLLESLE